MGRPKKHKTEQDRIEAHREACKKWYAKNGKNEKRSPGKTSKIVYVYNEDMELLYVFPSSAECARQLGLSQGNISNAARGALKRYNTLIFSYEKLETKFDRLTIEENGEQLNMKRKEQVKKAVSKYQKANPEAIRANARKYYNNHKQKIKERRIQRKNDK